MVVVVKGVHRLGESPFLKVEKPTMGSLQLISALQTQQLCQLWNAV